MSITRIERPLNIPALTGLRFVGATWVVLFHFRPHLLEAFPIFSVFDPVISQGGFGVPLFFILSGYLIWRNYSLRGIMRGRDTARFVWRRYARLWPVNVLGQLLAIPLIWWAVVVQSYWGAPIPDWYSIQGWFASAMMFGNLTNPSVAFPWNQPSWTLTAEMVAYFAFPLLLILFTLLRFSKLHQIAKQGFVMLAFIGAWAAQSFTGVFPYSWIIYLLYMFLVGTLLGVAGQFPFSSRHIATVAQIIAPLGVVYFSYSGQPPMVAACLAFWVWSLSTNAGLGAQFFSLNFMQVLGKSSYSVYILHWLIFGYVSIITFYLPVESSLGLKFLVIVQLAVVYLLAWACWRFIESPGRRILNTGFDRVWPAKQNKAFAATK